jgi:hypothetical protein
VTLHSHGIKDVSSTEETLAAEAEEKINANISKLNTLTAKVRQLFASSFDCEVDTQICNKDGGEKTSTVQVRRALSRYEEVELERSKRLAELWGSWEKTQAEIDELSAKLRIFAEIGFSDGISEMSLNRGWAGKEDPDIERQNKQVIEEMAACEEVSL